LIYFVRSPQGPIKIGTTIRLSQRLKQLAAEYGEGLEVLAVSEGSYATEKELHCRFAHLRQVGEWFEPGVDLLGFIVSDGKPWDGSDEKPDTKVPVRIEEDLIQMANVVASILNMSAPDYLSGILRPILERDYVEYLDRAAKQAGKKKPGGNKG
jgi:hypothetical protein